ncbi:hypothetical protein GCM10007872_26330 [Gluconobacter sphaericus NBRC 12467]|uniref:Uncharacterized protein n=1 Tax=Gluconobacter sphaericus NBRC 12467 TaxID=1307951 RepID=A0AA37SJ79_9PROT|nr:hypothetical protein GSP01_27930 [Gluconobacter sphaericus NBRC 12467]GLQ85723.1 hypothetical protein GCM10007872_26330 [Gluconobacter sphaericus NBRC 12467]
MLCQLISIKEIEKPFMRQEALRGRFLSHLQNSSPILLFQRSKACEHLLSLSEKSGVAKEDAYDASRKKDYCAPYINPAPLSISTSAQNADEKAQVTP